MTTNAHEVEATPINVTFSLSSPGARVVYVALFFNNWSAELPSPLPLSPGVHQKSGGMMVRDLVPLRQVKPGLWRCELPLSPGWHEYLFLVDHAWVMDPDALEVCPDGTGGFNAALMVKPVDRPGREGLGAERRAAGGNPGLRRPPPSDSNLSASG